MRTFFYCIFSLFLMGCSGLEKTEYDKMRKKNSAGDYIRRKSSDSFRAETPPKKKIQALYSWDGATQLYLPKITKEFFFCRGNPLNPKRYGKSDCEGALKHGLPTSYEKYGVHSTLIEILNYIQESTQQKVIITCGHRCATHSEYAEPGITTSKHTLGKEVDFYVRQMEYKPLDVINIVLQFYQSKNHHHDKKNFIFHRVNPKISKWKNKEVTISVIDKDKGRDFDNRHPYPYITIQINDN